MTETVCHTIERTSEPGGLFVGTCMLCGATGLKSWQALQPCPNPDGVTRDEALLKLLEPE